jgi:hypothetical protein
VDKFFDVKTKETKTLMRTIMETIVDNGLTDKNLFNFHNTKK